MLEVWGVHLTLHCHHQNDFCINMGGDESCVNVTLMMRDKVRRLSINLNFWKERRAEPTSAGWATWGLTARPNRLTSRAEVAETVHTQRHVVLQEDWRKWSRMNREGRMKSERQQSWHNNRQRLQGYVVTCARLSEESLTVMTLDETCVAFRRISDSYDTRRSLCGFRKNISQLWH